MSAELLKPIGLGFGLLGTTNTKPISDRDAQAMFDCACSLGVVRFDTAPLYGGGLSEERLGHLLRGIPRSHYVLSTKVGRYRPYATKVENPKRNRGDWNDYSYNGTLKSIENSLKRLGADRLDAVFVHDCDERIEDALRGALPALQFLKEQGVVTKVGCGSNVAATPIALLRHFDLEILMVAGRFTLLDQTATNGLFQICLNRGLEVELAAPFNSGILATGANDKSARMDYMAPDDGDRNRVRKIEAVCAEHGVSLKRAALQYSAAHPAVSRLILGLIHPDGMKSNFEDMCVPVPNYLWDALEGIGIPHPNPKALL